MKIPNPYLIAGAAVAAAFAYVALNGAKATGIAAGGAAVNLVDGVIGGAVIGTLDKFGVPATNLTECERAKAEGRTWDASFACPAGNFLTYLWK
jgi:hypothetical protein